MRRAQWHGSQRTYMTYRGQPHTVHPVSTCLASPWKKFSADACVPTSAPEGTLETGVRCPEGECFGDGAETDTQGGMCYPKHWVWTGCQNRRTGRPSGRPPGIGGLGEGAETNVARPFSSHHFSPDPCLRLSRTPPPRRGARATRGDHPLSTILKSDGGETPQSQARCLCHFRSGGGGSAGGRGPCRGWRGACRRSLAREWRAKPRYCRRC